MSSQTPEPAAKPDLTIEFTRSYYEHQYDRMAKLEEQRLTFTNIIVALTVVALTFGLSTAQGLTPLQGLGLPALIAMLNVFGAIYTWRTLQYIRVHRNRAKNILQQYAAALYEIDQARAMPHVGSRLGLAKIQLVMHAILTVAAGILGGLYLVSLL
jgi:hypothetical protein